MFEELLEFTHQYMKQLNLINITLLINAVYLEIQIPGQDEADILPF